MSKYLSGFILLFLVSCQSKQNILSNDTIKAFSEHEMSLILSDDIDQPMRVYKITNQSDSLTLRKKSNDIVIDTSDIIFMTLVKRLYRTVTDSASLGVGIAAPQVGILKNLIWLQRFDKDGFPFQLIINPKIIQYSNRKQPCPEGCLSIPNRNAITQNRAATILVEYDTLEGDHIMEMVEDFTAVIFQHEIDHLQGILFIDHLESESKQ